MCGYPDCPCAKQYFTACPSSPPKGAFSDVFSWLPSPRELPYHRSAVDLLMYCVCNCSLCIKRMLFFSPRTNFHHLAGVRGHSTLVKNVLEWINSFCNEGRQSGKGMGSSQAGSNLSPGSASYANEYYLISLSVCFAFL